MYVRECIKEDDNIGDLRVTIIATGFAQNNVADIVTTEPSLEEQPKENMNSVTSFQNSNNNIEHVDLSGQEDQTSIDIPAFLRQQAD